MIIMFILFSTEFYIQNNSKFKFGFLFYSGSLCSIPILILKNYYIAATSTSYFGVHFYLVYTRGLYRPRVTMPNPTVSNKKIFVKILKNIKKTHSFPIIDTLGMYRYRNLKEMSIKGINFHYSSRFSPLNYLCNNKIVKMQKKYCCYLWFVKKESI